MKYCYFKREDHQLAFYSDAEVQCNPEKFYLKRMNLGEGEIKKIGEAAKTFLDGKKFTYVPHEETERRKKRDVLIEKLKNKPSVDDLKEAILEMLK